MENEKIIDIILNKKFNKRPNAGYDPEDVDQFFDDVILKIKELNEVNTELQNKNSNSEKTILELKEKIERLESEKAELTKRCDQYAENGYGNLVINGALNSVQRDIKNLKEKLETNKENGK